MIGIVAEGPADIAVLRNILKGALGIDRDMTVAIRPELAQDATDLNGARGFRQQTPEEFSNWQLVLEECRAREHIANFLSTPVDENSFVVVHIDTAEAHLPGYDVARPAGDSLGHVDYCDKLRTAVVEKLAGLLGEAICGKVRYAVAIEETDAWLLTIHDKKDREKDTGTHRNPKKRLELALIRKSAARKGVPGGKQKMYKLYDELSRAFRDRETLEELSERNVSLRRFVESLIQNIKYTP